MLAAQAAEARLLQTEMVDYPTIQRLCWRKYLLACASGTSVYEASVFFGVVFGLVGLPSPMSGDS